MTISIEELIEDGFIKMNEDGLLTIAETNKVMKETEKKHRINSFYLKKIEKSEEGFLYDLYVKFGEEK